MEAIFYNHSILNKTTKNKIKLTNQTERSFFPASIHKSSMNTNDIGQIIKLKNKFPKDQNKMKQKNKVMNKNKNLRIFSIL